MRHQITNTHQEVRFRVKTLYSQSKKFADNQMMFHMSCSLMIVFFLSFACSCDAEKWASSDDETIKAFYKKQF